MELELESQHAQEKKPQWEEVLRMSENVEDINSSCSTALVLHTAGPAQH